MNNRKKIELNDVLNGIYSYGWYPALCALAKLEKKERYEECAMIKKAFDGLLVGRENEMPTQTDKKSLKKCYKKVMKSNKNGFLSCNMHRYVEQFEKIFE